MGLKKFVKKAYKQTGAQVDRARDPNRGVWGDSEYARLAERLTAASTFKTAIAERGDNYKKEGGFHLQGDIYKDTKPLIGGASGHDFKYAGRQGRPAMAYKDTVTAAPEREAEAEQMIRQAEAEAVFARQKDLQAKFDAGQVAARIRRGRRADQPGTKGGTIKTSGLGSTGQVSFAQLLGL